MVIIIEEENILKIRKINEIRGYSANLNILEKIIIWTIIVFLTLFFQTFIIGSGNGIDKLNFWTSDNVKFLMFCTNIIFYIIINLVMQITRYLLVKPVWWSHIINLPINQFSTFSIWQRINIINSINFFFL